VINHTATRARRFWAELKRRKVVRTAVTYMIAAGGIMGAAQAFSEALQLPPRAQMVLALVLIGGLPVAIVLAWLFDITRDEATGDLAAAGPESASLPPPAEAVRRYHLALPSTPLVGREAELAEAQELLTRPGSRLLTLTGPAGIGKTRLAQEVALHAGSRLANGTCFIALAGVESVDEVPAAIADALELPLTTSEPPLNQLGAFLQEKQLLLVLDNLEHLLDAAPFISRLLSSSSGLQLVATSQRRLRIAGETVLSLDALSVPEPGTPLEHSAAAVLFLQIAQRNDPRFQADAEAVAAIARICRVVGGIPLAIELAAASVGPLSCLQVAEALEAHHAWVLSARRDLPPRHQSLSAAFESSWRLLEPEEQHAFRRLSVLRGAFYVEAAAEVAGAELRMLGGLVEASLLRRVSAREHEILPVLREFGEEKLRGDAAELAQVQANHARYFLGRLEALASETTGPDQDAASERLARSAPDLRVAWLRASAQHDHQALGRATQGLYLLLDRRGRSNEGAELFERAAAAVRPLAQVGGPEGDDTSITFARLLARQAAFLAHLGRISDAGRMLREALPLLRAGGDRAELAFALCELCLVLRNEGDYRAPEFEETLALYRETGDQWGVARALNALGAARHALGEYQEAKRLYRESIDQFRRIGLAAEAWPAVNNLAGIALVEGDLQAARRILESELDTYRQRDNLRALTFLLGNLGLIEYRLGDYGAAVPVLEESARIAREMGYRSLLGYSLNTLGNISLERNDLAGAERTYRQALRVARDAEGAPLVPEVVVGLARVRLQQGEPENAAALLAAVEEYPASDQETRSSARALLEPLRSAGAAPAAVASLEEVVRRFMNEATAPSY